MTQMQWLGINRKFNFSYDYVCGQFGWCFLMLFWQFLKTKQSFLTFLRLCGQFGWFFGAFLTILPSKAFFLDDCFRIFFFWWSFSILGMFILTCALSFYKSQNVLGLSKFFVPDQKFIYILWQSQNFCARQKDDLHSVKLVFVPAQKFLKRH